MTRVSRRGFVRTVAALGASAAGLAVANGCGLLPFAARPRVARVGFLWSGSEMTGYVRAAFRDGLRDAGWVEGQNLVIEDRTYREHPERIPDLAAELVASKPDVLLAGSTDVVQALLRASDSIPIVFGGVTDPVGSGLIANYARPGGNVTGTSRNTEGSLGPKVLDLLRQLIPGLARVAVPIELWNPGEVNDWRAIQAAAPSIGIDAQAVGIASADDLEGALDAALVGRPQALILAINGGTLIPATNQAASNAIMDFALQRGLPTTTWHGLVGVLLHYGPDLVLLYRRAGSYHVDRILRGVKPADLPVEGPTVFDLVINRTAAQALGIAMPPEFAAQVTEWIQ